MVVYKLFNGSFSVAFLFMVIMPVIFDLIVETEPGPTQPKAAMGVRVDLNWASSNCTYFHQMFSGQSLRGKE